MHGSCKILQKKVEVLRENCRQFAQNLREKIFDVEKNFGVKKKFGGGKNLGVKKKLLENFLGQEKILGWEVDFQL